MFQESKQDNAAFFIKATDQDMRGDAGNFQFEIGKVYTHPGPVVVCQSGFHCCAELDHIAASSWYRPTGDTRYFIVKAWGRHDVENQTLGHPKNAQERQLTGHVVGRLVTKHAFECVEFVTELKHSTLEDVQRAMAAIGYAFQDKPALREANLRQFMGMQQKFPSILKKRTKSLRNRLIVLEDVNHPRHTMPIVKTYHSEFPRELVWRVGAYHDKLMRNCGTHVLVDVYHHNHEPQIGLSPADADAYCIDLIAKNKVRD